MSARGAIFMVVLAAAAVLFYMHARPASSSAAGGGVPAKAPTSGTPNAFSSRDRLLAAGGSTDAGAGALRPSDPVPQTRGDAIAAGLFQ